VTFVLSGLKEAASALATRGSSASSVQKHDQSGVPVSAITSVDGETFPELSLTLQDVAWPMISNAQNCVPDGGAGQDGDAACSRTISLQTQSSEEPPAGDLVTIQLNLVLARVE
jgi:hypothetical protein